MANVVTTVTLGDYRYTLYDDQTAAAMVTDWSKSSYEALQASVTHEGVTYALKGLYKCFYDCTSLTTAPAIPSGVTSMVECFRGCSALVSPPSIPDTVTNLEHAFRDCTSMTTPPTLPSSATKLHGCFRGCTSLSSAPAIPVGAYNIAACFYGCTSLTTAPSIPSSVTQVQSCFSQCTALTGNISVSGTPSSYSNCFLDTVLPIRLLCSSDTILPTWQQVAATGNNGNVIAVYVENNPAPTATLNVTRVGSDGSTVPNESGEWAYVRVETTISTDQAPDNVARAPIITKDGSSVVPSTHASGTSSYVDWVSLGDDKTHRIGATPRDLYKSGGEVIVPLAGTYSPMEFYTKPILNDDDEVIGYEGGVGASFGKHATREGVLDVAWDIESEGDISADGALSCADGSPYCSDGTNVKVGGQTVGSADNLSYVINPPTTCSFTRDNTNVNWGVSDISRKGDLVQLSLIGDLKSNWGIWQNITLGTISPAPASDRYFYAFSNDSIARYILVQTSGTVMMRTLAKAVDTAEGKSFRGSWLFSLT